ncbi:hypothetical protein AgCh_034026 [Apium graveolens]
MDQLLIYDYESLHLALATLQNILGITLTARDRLLKPGGLIIPSRATLYIAPVTLPDRYSEKIDFWHNVYGIDNNQGLQQGVTGVAKNPIARPNIATPKKRRHSLVLDFSNAFLAFSYGFLGLQYPIYGIV